MSHTGVPRFKSRTGAGWDQLCEFEYTLHCDMQAKGSRVWLAADAKMAHETWTRFWDGVDANNNMKRLLAASRATSREWMAPTRAMSAWDGADAVSAHLASRRQPGAGGRRTGRCSGPACR